tara:strand:+ start:5689 stop:7056 length:1368 start_codon:yes stop_codon:yes gene_type:complete
MKYLSTRNNKLNKSFKDILFQGLSKDGGLFLPKEWPKINLNELKDKSYEEVALTIMQPYFDNEVPRNDMNDIICNSYKKFKHPKIAPLVKIDKNRFILELFHGPTLAFKDYALQFLGNLLSYFNESNNQNITILGATSGDTGSAAINAFKGKKNIKIIILHPHKKVSDIQRRQMTTVLDSNVYNIAIEGNFDDCQRIVKELFIDKDIQKATSLTAVNSINWARIMAQIVYYFWAFIQLDQKNLSFIVPSGNFGNIYSARVAKHMGLPINQLHLVTNQNDMLHKIISIGKMVIQNVQETHSPSMDIQISSNFERQIFESLKYNSEEVKKIMESLFTKKSYAFDQNTKKSFQDLYRSTSISNERTLEIIKIFKEKYNYLADPHSATGLSVMHENNFELPVVSLGCAHPAKFASAIKESLGIEPKLPIELEKILSKEEKMIILPNNSKNIKQFILNII